VPIYFPQISKCPHSKHKLHKTGRLSIKVKKITVFAIFLFLILSEIRAQSPVDVGIRGGVNLAGLGNVDFDTRVRTGILAGIYADIALPVLPFDLETGVYFSQKGVEFDESDVELTFKLDYIEIPVLVKIPFGNLPQLKPYFLAGPYAEFNVNAEVKTEGPNDIFIVDLDDETEFFNFGALAGIGADLDIGLITLNFQGRFGLGLRDVFNDQFSDGEKHQVFSILAGFSF